MRGGKLQIGFIIDPKESLKPAYDSSMAMMRLCKERHHTVFVFEYRDLAYRDGELVAKVEEVIVADKAPYFTVQEERTLRLTELSALLIRKDPPFDDSYLYLTQLLTPLADKLLIVNSPLGLLTFNEKLAILN